VAGVSIFFSCAPARLPSKKIDAGTVLSDLAKNRVNYEWFSAKARVNYEDKSISRSFNASVRMRRDSIIWISVTTIMGVEAARLLIHDDTVFFIDRLNNSYQTEPLSFLERYVPFPLEIGLIQNMLTGNPVSDSSCEVGVKKDKNSYVLLCEDELYRHLINLDEDDLSISTEHLVDRQNDRTLSLVFDDYKNEAGRLFSYLRKISITGDDKITLSLRFSKVRWDEPMEFPFHVSRKKD